MTEDFTGKVALVTGGGNGIGAATCRAFVAAGAQVAIVDRNAAAAEAIAAEITSHNGYGAAYSLDVADRDAFARLTEGVAEAWGGIDILVNGAGTTIRRMIGEMSAEDWNRVITVNLTGAITGAPPWPMLGALRDVSGNATGCSSRDTMRSSGAPLAIRSTRLLVRLSAFWLDGMILLGPGSRVMIDGAPSRKTF